MLKEIILKSINRSLFGLPIYIRHYIIEKKSLLFIISSPFILIYKKITDYRLYHFIFSFINPINPFGKHIIFYLIPYYKISYPFPKVFGFSKTTKIISSL